MPKTQDNKRFLKRMALWMHISNERVNVGWNVYLAPYISMLYYLSLMEIVVAKLFPDLFMSATELAVASYIAFIWISYRFGKRHEHMEVVRKRSHLQTFEQVEAMENRIRQQRDADIHKRLDALEGKVRRQRRARK
jgi:hypothetical protein